MDVGSKKLFIGREGKDGVSFTRLRTSFERFMPKFIIRITKNAVEPFYQVRFSFLSMAIFLVFSVNLLLGFGRMTIYGFDLERTITLLVVYGFYVALIFFELSIYKRRVAKAIAMKLTLTKLA